MANQQQPVWGIDLGGTKIECAVLQQPNSTQTLLRHRIATEAHKGYHHIVKQVGQLVKTVRQQTGLKPERIGIGTPGAREPQTGLMKNCNTTCLNGQPLLHDLTNTLQIPITMANDANCLALAEAKLGAAKGANVVFGVILGTGVGGGVVVNGQVINGLQGIAGEWGMNVAEPDGQINYSGIRGTVESVLSGPALEKYFYNRTGTQMPLQQIAALAQQPTHKHTNHAKATLHRLCYYLGRSLASVINVLDPDVVVIGGGVGNIDAIYSQGIHYLEHFVFNTQLKTKIVKPQLGDSGGVFGAAMLVS